MYKKVNSNLDFVQREKETIAFWKERNVFERSIQQTENGEEFSFYDGPPTANGKPHIGHILTRSMKDIIPRYKTMKGYHVLRKAGWDTHGLPVELEVEKALGMDGKQDIETYGIEPFIDQCKQSVWKYKKDWEDMSERVGFWVDMDDPYVTYEDRYIESVWWSLKEIFDKGLIYKGYKIVPYCPRCGTALSSHEVAQAYKDVEEQTAVVKFKALDRENTYYLAWTTTPWTLPSNVALCVGPEYEYALIESDGVRYILAKELVPNFFETYTLLEVLKGNALEGEKYQPLYNFDNADERVNFKITVDGYVTLTDGTGIVHIAPAFGEDDARVGKQNGLTFVQMVNEQGKFIDRAGSFRGMFCKDADKHILKDLSERSLLFQEMKHTHSYPFCWRCDTPLLYYARNTWFIRMSELRENLLKNNASIRWIPEAIGKGRMANFLENVVDWGLSRERYWGTPLPIWVCEDCGHTVAVGSKEELRRLGGVKKDIELHKPYVDQITFGCEKCGKVMKRTPEVIDCWYDSGAMPFAQYHYPFENRDLFEKTFPANFISEAVDQTRGWFYTLLAISTILFEKAPFQNCIVLGHVNDKNGQKMSKHKGNVVDPWSILDKQGADAVRWYFYTNSSPWLPSRFYDEAVSEVQRKFLGTLWNTYSFYVLYAEIDQFDPTKRHLEECALSLMDQWILSALHSLIQLVDGNLTQYKITESARAISDFTDSLSNWYVRRCRERYWASAMEDDKVSAYMTLYTVLSALAKLTAPFIPFMAESIYQNIVCSVDKQAPESVHLCEFPTADTRYIDRKLEQGMDLVLHVAALGRAARNSTAIKNRQPLARMLVSGDRAKTLSVALCDVLKDELNIKEITFAEHAEEYIGYEVKPQLKTLGPKYGNKLNAIRAHLTTHGKEAAAAVQSGTYTFDADGTPVELTEEDLLVAVVSKAGYSAQSDKGITVVLDITLTEELVEEGIMRELVSKLQTMRKENGFEVTDRIKIGYQDDQGPVAAVLEKRKASISADVLADSIAPDLLKHQKQWDINGHPVILSVERIKKGKHN